MGEGGLNPSPSFTQIFDELCPYYMSIGMTYEQFWNDDPSLTRVYRKADELRRERRNQELWLAGVYTVEALTATVGNMFSKQKHRYPEEPYPLTQSEVEAKRKRDEQAKMERIKAKFMARALKMNTNRRDSNDTKR